MFGGLRAFLWGQKRLYSGSSIPLHISRAASALYNQLQRLRMFGGFAPSCERKSASTSGAPSPHILNEPASALYESISAARMFGAFAPSLRQKSASTFRSSIPLALLTSRFRFIWNPAPATECSVLSAPSCDGQKRLLRRSSSPSHLNEAAFHLYVTYVSVSPIAFSTLRSVWMQRGLLFLHPLSRISSSSGEWLVRYICLGLGRIASTTTCA